MIGTLLIVTLCVKIRLTHCLFASTLTFIRGSEGVLPCDAMKEGGYKLSDTEAVYWDFCPKGSSDSPRSIMTFYHGETTSTENNHGQYSLRDTSLVIKNVSYLTEGKYTYSYMPWKEDYQDGSVEVFEKVPSKSNRPRIKGCDRGKEACGVTVSPDTTDFNLVCSVEHAKPAVNITWFRLSEDGREDINATLKFEFITCNAQDGNCFSYNNTFNSTSTVTVSLKSKNSTFVCVTYSTDLKNATVTVTKGAFVANKELDNVVTETTAHLKTCSTATAKPTSLATPEHQFPFSGGGLALFLMIGVFIGMVTLLLIGFKIAAWRKNLENEPVDIQMKCAAEVEKCIV